ncbi:hypothetical protein PHLCEN_2v5290 [Hermanssonia centrifuga]|uniref:Amine oxidase domain-containing protein n=1 Tax=Hermanssonia centrifuga TaxID=98765 RepID=A0A2R6P8G5_9APHY|nr:hypothetical protein PHLCEN_2v5290 [Hermanssonia centrifuga]
MTLPRLYLLPLVLTTLVCSTLALPTSRSSQSPFAAPRPSQPRDAKVLVLGGGVAGVIAARTLHEQGISEFIIVEARHELGGRLMSHTFGVPGREYTVELGANWVQGTQSGNGPENPIWTLAKKHGLQTQHSSYFDGLCEYPSYVRYFGE